MSIRNQVTAGQLHLPNLHPKISSQKAFITADMLTCHSRRSTTLKMAPFYSSFPVRVTVSQHTACQDPEIKIIIHSGYIVVILT